VALGGSPHITGPECLRSKGLVLIHSPAEVEFSVTDQIAILVNDNGGETDRGVERAAQSSAIGRGRRGIAATGEQCGEDDQKQDSDSGIHDGAPGKGKGVSPGHAESAVGVCRGLLWALKADR